MRIKAIAGLALLTLLASPLSSYAAGRRMIPTKTAQQGFQLPISGQGLAITIPGQQITFIQLSHLSNVVCTTDNGNMCATGGGTANLIYLRRISLTQPVPGQIASPDGSTLLLLKTNGGACEALCPITLVPSSAVPKFNVVEIGVDPPMPSKPLSIAKALPSRVITPIAVPKLPTLSTLPSVEVDLPAGLKGLQEVPPPPVDQPPLVVQSKPAPEQKKEAIKVSPTAAPALPVPQALPKKKVQTKLVSPASPAVKPARVTQSKVIALNSSGMSPRVLANRLVMGLTNANRTKEIPYYSVKSRKVQTLVRILRRNRPLSEAMKQSGLTQKDVDQLLRLSGK